jgi:hypothetical protein
LGHSGRVSFFSRGLGQVRGEAVPSEPPSLESIKSSLDEIEAAVDSEDTTSETLAGFR